jgi:serine/threonine protein kinase
LIIVVFYSSESNTWKIGDFGLTVSGTSKNPITTKEAKGSTCYRAPELLRNDPKYNNKVDIWAIGCITYEVAAEQKAFSDDLETLDFNDQEKKLPEDIVLDEGPKQLIVQIIRQCLRIEPKERPTTLTIGNWLKEYLGLSGSVVKLENTQESTSHIDESLSIPGISCVLQLLIFSSNRPFAHGRCRNDVGDGSSAHAPLDEI